MHIVFISGQGQVKDIKEDSEASGFMTAKSSVIT
jgi:hypothetical protein